MQTALIDFDDTLLNTEALKDALASSLDVSRTQWDAAYQAYVADNGSFDPEGFLEGVAADQRIAFAAVLRKMQMFLYPDSLAFLKAALTEQWRVVILTQGDKQWQTTKLKSVQFPVGVEIRVTATDKTAIVSEYLTDRTVIIDDRASVIDAVKQLHPQVHTYWMRRPAGAHRTPESKLCDNMIEDLSINL